MATVTKAMLVKNVCSETGLSPKDAATLVDSCFEAIKATLESGEEVKLPGLGSHYQWNQNVRQGAAQGFLANAAQWKGGP